MNDARSHKEALGYEVQELKRERTQLQSQLQTSQKHCAELTSELSTRQLEGNGLTAQVSKFARSYEPEEDEAIVD